MRNASPGASRSASAYHSESRLRVVAHPARHAPGGDLLRRLDRVEVAGVLDRLLGRDVVVGRRARGAERLALARIADRADAPAGAGRGQRDAVARARDLGSGAVIEDRHAQVGRCRGAAQRGAEIGGRGAGEPDVALERVREEHAARGLRAGRVADQRVLVRGGRRERQRVRRADAGLPGEVAGGGGAGRAQVDVDVLRARDRPVGVVAPDVLLVLDRHGGLGVDPVGDAEEVVIEPAVQRVDPLGATRLERILMAGAQQPQLARDVVGLQGVPPHAHVVHADVVVLDAVGGEHGRLDLARVLDVVTVAPELVDVAVRITVAGEHVRVVGDRRVHAACRSPGGSAGSRRAGSGCRPRS